MAKKKTKTTVDVQNKMAKGIAWFRNNSVDAYFDLID